MRLLSYCRSIPIYLAMSVKQMFLHIDYRAAVISVPYFCVFQMELRHLDRPSGRLADYHLVMNKRVYGRTKRVKRVYTFKNAFKRKTRLNAFRGGNPETTAFSIVSCQQKTGTSLGINVKMQQTRFP